MTIQDQNNPNIHFVLNGTTPVGYVEQFAPKEWKAFNVKGEFIGWYTSKRLAVGAL